METNTYPQSSIPTKVCSRCKSTSIESGSYRERKHRDVGGMRTEKVLRLRCSNCKRSVGCVYPEGVLRHKWYSLKVHGMFAILDVHQVDEACANELAAWLGYPIKPETRAAWQRTEVWRSEHKGVRERVGWDLEFLYQSPTLEDAERSLTILNNKYGIEPLIPLTNAWQQLKNYWLVDGLPLTNNASETLYNALWPRQRKRVIKTLERTLDWFKQARWRWNHHLVQGLSPWQRFTGKASPHWLSAFVTPLSRSTDFSG